MKNRIISAVFILLSITLLQPGAQQALPLEGTWTGILSPGGLNLRIVFHLVQKNGKLTATMDSPDQGVKGIPVSRVSLVSDILELEVSSVKGLYSGRISANGMHIEGVWKQSGAEFALNLERQDPNAPLAQSNQQSTNNMPAQRPQEPKPPFPYSSHEVVFKNIKAGIKLSGTLTIPAGKGPFPGVVLVSGSGPQNRNEEILGHKPFLVIADFLARHGVAALRYDDRGVGESRGKFAGATTFDFADDAEAAVEYLASRDEILKDGIGIIGHSEGGLIAPIVAANNSKVNYIVLLAGPGIRGDQLLALQNAEIGRASGMTEASIAKAWDMNKKLYAIAIQNEEAAALEKAIADEVVRSQDPDGKADAAQRKALEAQGRQVAAQLLDPWMRSLLALDPAPYLEKTSVPVLALNGSMDLQVPADENLAAIQKALFIGGNQKVTIVKPDGLNHLFQHSKTGLPSEYGIIEETFAPEALDIMLDWIVRLFSVPQ